MLELKVSNAKLYDAENEGEKQIERQRQRIQHEADNGQQHPWHPEGPLNGDAGAHVRNRFDAAVQAATEQGLRPMLVEVADVRMSFEARQVLLGTHFVSAVALVGNTVVDRVVAAALLRDQVCPHGYFTSLDEGSLRLARSAAPDTFEEATL